MELWTRLSSQLYIESFAIVFYNSFIKNNTTKIHFYNNINAIDKNDFVVSSTNELIIPIYIIPRIPTQLYEAISYWLIFCFLFWGYWKRDWYIYSGKLFGAFFTLLFASRFFVEFFSLPNKQWYGFLTNTLSLKELISAMWKMFRKSPWTIKQGLMNMHGRELNLLLKALIVNNKWEKSLLVEQVEE